MFGPDFGQTLKRENILLLFVSTNRAVSSVFLPQTVLIRLVLSLSLNTRFGSQ